MYPYYWYSYPFQNQNRVTYTPVNHPNHYRQQLDPTLFMTSANDSQLLLNDALTIVRKISTDQNFARKIMEAARESKFSVVESLIASIGVSSIVDIWFNPDGMRIELPTNPQDKGKAMLKLSLIWQDFPHFV